MKHPAKIYIPCGVYTGGTVQEGWGGGLVVGQTEAHRIPGLGPPVISLCNTLTHSIINVSLIEFLKINAIDNRKD